MRTLFHHHLNHAVPVFWGFVLIHCVKIIRKSLVRSSTGRSLSSSERPASGPFVTASTAIQTEGLPVVISFCVCWYGGMSSKTEMSSFAFRTVEFDRACGTMSSLGMLRTCSASDFVDQD